MTTLNLRNVVLTGAFLALTQQPLLAKENALPAAELKGISATEVSRKMVDIYTSPKVNPVFTLPGPQGKYPQSRQIVGCTLFGPADVQGYDVTCQGGTFINFGISDGFIPGDHWSLKGKMWDANPNTSVVTSPGPVINFGGVSQIYTYGGAQNPNPRAYLQCTYLHGVNIFPAGSFIAIASDAASCTVTPDPIRSRIDRMP